MSNSDTPLVAIKEAEASFAKLTMEDKLSHPPPDIVSLCTLNIKRLKISDTAPLPVDATPSNEHQVWTENVVISDYYYYWSKSFKSTIAIIKQE